MGLFRNIINWIQSIFQKEELPDDVVVPPTPVPPLPQPIDSLEVIKLRLLELHNAERVKRGAKPLVRRVELDRAAQKHNDWMARTGRLNHNEPGNDVGERVSNEGYEWSRVGENIAWGQKTPEEAMDSWMNSSGHRSNILNNKFTDVGFGVTQDGRTNWWWTADFGTE